MNPMRSNEQGSDEERSQAHGRVDGGEARGADVATRVQTRLKRFETGVDENDGDGEKDDVSLETCRLDFVRRPYVAVVAVVVLEQRLFVVFCHHVIGRSKDAFLLFRTVLIAF